LKRELVIYGDIGLVGTFVGWQEKATEPGYRYLEYVPLNTFPPRKKIFPTAIHIDHIHILHSTKNDAGIVDRMIFIYTGEAGSLIKGVLQSDNIETIKELRERVRKLKMQVASSKQSEEDARSGVNKAISSMKQMQRGGSGGAPPQQGFNDPFGPRYPSQSRGYDYEDFDNY
jgi:hypothetical protein